MKKYESEHICCRSFTNKQANKKWVCKKLEKRLRTQPLLKHGEAVDHMKKDYNVHLDDKMVYRALKRARELVEGGEKEQYGKVRDYLTEILRSNPGSTALMNVIMNPESPPIFQRMYIYLDACKKRFQGWL